MAVAVRRIAAPLRRWCTSRLNVLRSFSYQKSSERPGSRAIMNDCETLSAPAGYVLGEAGRRRYCSGLRDSTRRLLSCVESEVGLEQKQIEDMPPVTGFTASVQGCVATLERQHGQETVKVQMDTNHALEVMPDEEEDEVEPFFVPTFTVSVSNKEGDCLHFDCSFDEQGFYTEQANEWENMRIDSLYVISRECQDTGTVYSVAAENLSSELYDHLLEYLKERSINEKFASEIVQFYKVYEHRCYLEQCLKALKQFLQNS